MSEKKFGKRLLTWALVIVMILTVVPLNVLADETDTWAAEGYAAKLDPTAEVFPAAPAIDPNPKPRLSWIRARGRLR